MSAASAAATGRRLAESLMTSTCSIAPPGAEPVTDPETGEVTAGAGATVYSGPCRVRPTSSQAQSSTRVGGAEAFTFDYLVSVPFSATTVREGMTLTVDASPDPALVGVRLDIQKVDRGEHITARRLACNEVA